MIFAIAAHLVSKRHKRARYSTVLPKTFQKVPDLQTSHLRGYLAVERNTIRMIAFDKPRGMTAQDRYG